jgi:hypothetical protein
MQAGELDRHLENPIDRHVGADKGCRLQVSRALPRDLSSSM